MKKNTLKYDLLLILVAMIWGTGFVGTDYVLEAGVPFSLLIALRMLFAMIFMLLFFFKKIRVMNRTQVKHGIIAGSLMGLGFVLQTAGLQYTEVSSNAFLTAMNVIFVPFISWMLLKKRPHAKIFVCVILGFFGMFILTRAYEASLNFNIGNLLSLLCAVAYAFQIAYIGFAAKDSEPVSFTFVQIAVTCAIGFALFALLDLRQFVIPPAFHFALLGSAYLGIVCTAIAFMLQCLCQSHMNAPRAALIMSLEGLFASILSVWLGLEPLQASLVVGGLIITASVFLLELNLPKRPRLSK